ncbi:MAG: chorismate synthase [Clostridiales bacterium]|nr:chorismate synthase [Clostridiales bacterium]
MAGSTYGDIFKITTWGESHGKAVGVVVDGCPAGLTLCEEDIQKFLDRRRPGRSVYATSRRESDIVEILSGVFEGKTTGSPISLLVRNTDHHSADYSDIADKYRPGHADYTFDAKYGFRDYRGGGRSSGRETIGRVAAGAIAVRLLNELGISLLAYVKSIGQIHADMEKFDPGEIGRNPLCMPDALAAARAEACLGACIQNKDSMGGVIECVISGLPAGIGEPVFDKLDARLASAVMSIGAVKGFETGDGFAAAAMHGSENNDPFITDYEGHIIKQTNHSGGTLGGISDGGELIFRAALKPTPSIAQPQQTVTSSGEPTIIEIKGRHDPVIAPRAVVVVESMAALTIADLMLENMGSRLEYVKKIYNK